ncbi:dehydratase [Streptomyces sulfonofaciens]|uniref:Dehydratase n=1 Tax=Streptomyces sulfonofaciens TaxID=68272 RepID=A0A919G1Y2_9ACTN|nr:NAD-dependent epimerase/dehydratase family protein [Streptomyces sulfonofaciens]GHH76732.1 dehydratase [Streptomyces sulfonofaciens]
MRVVVIGGTGHIGTYLIPLLVSRGHEVTVLSRGLRRPYRTDGGWRHVRTIETDRTAEEAAGDFGDRVARLGADVVIDLICFTEQSAEQLNDALEGRVGHLLHCGTIWVHGPSAAVPTTEDSVRRPLGRYGIEKAAIEKRLLARARRGGLPATVIHPGHITGPGWAPINPAGHLDPGVFEDLADGSRVVLPNLGMETLQHVHAADVAGVFLAAVNNRSVAVGESFHAVADGAVTLRGYAEAAAGWFGRDADLDFLPWDEWSRTVPPQQAETTRSHLEHSPHCSMAKTARLLGFRPRYSVLEATEEAVLALVDEGRIVVGDGAGPRARP